MADQDELFYLSPDFNPGSLTVANIRNILVKHEIDYPASAKKGDLVAIFDRELKPQAKKLMRRADDVRRRSSGIEDVNGVDHDAPTTSRGNHRQTESISSETQGRALRRSTRQTSVDGENEGLTVPPRSPVKRTSTRSSRASTAEPASETDSVARKKRTHVRGTILPTVQDVQDEDSDVEIVGEGKAFTQDNPFQRSINKPEELEDHRRSTTVRRRVEHTPLAKAAVIHEDPTPKQRQSMPSSKAQKMYASMTPRPERSSLPTPEPEVDDSDEVLDEEYIQDPINAGRADYLLDADPRLQAGEEFSPDEQLELDQMLQSDIDQQALVPRASKRSKATAGALKSLAYASLSILVALTSVFGVFWRQEKIAVGYCDIGREPFLSSWERESLHAQQLRENGITVPSWAYGTIQPLCQSCPVHAVCYDNLITRCDDGFLPTQHPLNPFGLLPLAPTCQPDGIKAHRVAQMTARAIRELRKIRAAAECRLKGADGQPTKTAEIEVQSLQAKVYNEMFKASKKPRMSDEQFEDLWKIVLEDVKARDEVSFTPSPPTSNGHSYLSSSSLALAPLLCTIRLRLLASLRRSLVAHRLALSLLIFFILTILYLRSLYRQRQRIAALLPALVDDSLNLLRRQAKRAELRNGREDAFLSAGQLRDDLLRNERSLAFRAKVWKGVGVVVERNANVRVSVREGGRSGEVSRVWEWVGDTGDWEDWREGGRLSGGGASGRVSYGGGMGGAGYGFEDDGESEISLVEDNGLVEPKSLVGVGVGNGMGNGIAGARRAAYF